MPDDTQHINFTAKDILQYHKGQLSPQQMHALEKAALDDPFLADALDGYSADGVDRADIEQLQKRLEERMRTAKVIPLHIQRKTSYAWWKAAAIVIFISGAGLLVYRFAFSTRTNELAQVEKKDNNPVKHIDSITAPLIKTNVTAPIKESTGNVTVTKPEPKKITVTNDPPVIVSSKPSISTQQTLASTTTRETLSHPVQQPNEGYMKKQNTSASDSVEFKSVTKAKLADDEKKLSTADGDGVTDQFDRQKNENAVSKNGTFNRKADNQFVKTNIFRGRITDANNNPVPFANITNTEDNAGTYSDAKGYFNLTSPDSILNVQVRSIGFDNNVAQLRTNVPNNQVMMQDDRKSLSEFVISNKRPNTEAQSRNGNIKIEESEPTDGWDNYDIYLVNNTNIPEEVRSRQVPAGSVELSFEVDKNGDPTNIKVEKSLCAKCDLEAIRIVKQGPKWKRKNRNGRTTVSIPFTSLP